ncbi:threonine--tRNA ligase [Pedomonas mirosovicensis]|uniref:threonine--tRNA ligase n=1 Tax=Pedomonas mirosovicensis TaxID=2908641 RepID=UPI00216A7CBE|nr:threonine--tRNA ligase [Pedomonas mirosovicensis]MCH8683918.1 threonine--tRNA ligase [Pedomonas mirosovicensis]
MNDASLRITLPDGSVREMARGTTPADVAASIGAGLAKAALAARVNGDLWDLNRPLEGDAQLALITSRDTDDALDIVRHDFAHVLAEAVQELFPGTQVTIGPSIEDGFYYDFAPAGRGPFTEDDLPVIEEKMREIIARDEPITREVWNREEAIKHFNEIGEVYKAQIIDDIIAPGEPITVYRQGNWKDLCRGPHLPSTGKLNPEAFKLTKVAGAYWRGDHRNAMLSRIYGTAWLNKKDLEAYLHRIEEAEKRDHRKLGREMDLFHLQEEAHGSVFWHPNGWVLWQALEQYMRRRLNDAGYVEVRTPQLYHNKFWKTSGHWAKFRAGMFLVPDEIPNIDTEEPKLGEEPDFLALKPMNCPGHIQIFDQGIKSYRDLPIRMTEFGCCHRNEPHGALHGLMRVRQFTQDDAHIFCRDDQFIDETIGFCELLKTVYADLGFPEFKVHLATRPELRAGSDEVWDRAEKGLEDAVKAAGYEYQVFPGEGAFYGPKLEFHLRDAIGRTWQCGTIQLDFVLPERFDISYVAEDGSRQRPVMLHRAILGSMERFIAILIESYAGKFPLWLAPRQVVVATIVSDANDYAVEVTKALKAAGIRAEADIRNEKINYKVREHSLGKVPYLLVVGKREAEERTVAVRRLGSDEKQQVASLDEIIARLKEEGTPPDLRG